MKNNDIELFESIPDVLRNVANNIDDLIDTMHAIGADKSRMVELCIQLNGLGLNISAFAEGQLRGLTSQPKLN